MDQFREVKVQIFLRPDGKSLLSMKAVAQDGQMFYQAAAPSFKAPAGEIVKGWVEEASVLYALRLNKDAKK